MENVQALVERQMSSAMALRRRLHQIPELAYGEFQTADTIRAELGRMRVTYFAGVEGAPTATVAIIGDESKPCIALRADIDALPIEERTNVEYASRNKGRMHACGHDGHASNLVGVAGVLKQIDRDLPVCVKLIWQPAEEGGGGAKRLVDAGVLDGRIGPKVDAIFGLHGWPGLKVGMVASKVGPIMAAQDTFAVEFTGRGCHGAFPHLGRDPIVAACEAVCSLQQIVSREMDPTEPAVVTVGTIAGGTAVNIIPDTARITGTMRTLSQATREHVRDAIMRRTRAVAEACGCEACFDWTQGYPPTVNDPGMVDRLAATARRVLGPDQFVPVDRPAMGAEDFAYYLEKVPGCFFMIGLEPPDSDGYPSLHSDRFDFTDSAMVVGMRVMVELVLNA